MIAQWMLSIAATAALLAVAARALEEGLRVYGRPARWVWVAALAGSVLLPLAGALTGGAFPGGWLRAPASSLDLSALILEIEPAVQAAQAPVATSRSDVLVLLERALAAAWLLGSAAVLLLYLGTWRRLGRSMRGWPAGTIDGTPVLVSGQGGPAVVGLVKPAIVVPSWLLAENEAAVRCVVLHEREHVRARDHTVLALAPLVAAAMPWNPAIWWQLRRLRLAVELDCDRRVLAWGIEARAYGTLLLEIAGRSSRPLAGAAALAEPRTFLERRIMAMSRGTPRHRPARAFAFTASAAVLALVACETASPTNVNTPAPDHDIAEAAVVERPSRATATMQEEGPMVVVDGEVRSAGILRLLDPDAIDRIEVIKGGAAVALYGERAADGVIQIFTVADGATAERTATYRMLGELTAAAKGTLRRVPGWEAEAVEVERRVRTTSEVKKATTAGTYTVRQRASGEQPAKVALRASESVRGEPGAVVARTRAEQIEVEARRSAVLRELTVSPVETGDAEVAVRAASPLRKSAVGGNAALRAVELQRVLLRDDLVVFIDGTRVTRDAELTDLDVGDIESIEVVKGKAAEAIGISDGRSVIRISTRR